MSVLMTLHMATKTAPKKVLTEAQKQNRVLKALAQNDGEATASELVELTGLPKKELNDVAKALVRAKKVVPAAGGKIALPADEEEEAPAPKAKAKKPVPIAKAKPAPKKKPAPPVEEEDEEDDDDLDITDEEDDDSDFDDEEDEAIGPDDDEDEEEEDDEEAEEESDDDDDDEFELDDDEGLDDDDEEEEAPTPKAKKGSAKKSALEAPHKQFTMAFKPIDTLADDELEDRIEQSLLAAESLAKQKHTLVAEMLMRSVAKARRQLNKRS